MKTIVLISIIAFSIFSCEKEQGCMDNSALNFDGFAERDDGSCNYSRVTFFASAGFFNGIPITKIEVEVGGDYLGTISSIYPNGPGNCSANGTLSYVFQNGDSREWNSKVYLASGAIIFGSGRISPSRSQECIRTNVTR
jgi:hypothetical protein